MGVKLQNAAREDAEARKREGKARKQRERRAERRKVAELTAEAATAAGYKLLRDEEAIDADQLLYAEVDGVHTWRFELDGMRFEVERREYRRQRAQHQLHVLDAEGEQVRLVRRPADLADLLS